MNGWEQLYEAMRYYEDRPHSAMARDFIDYMGVNARVFITLMVYPE